MAVCIGASYGGARAFTATSSQGLALMHELLHWAGGGRLPIVMVDVNRAMAPGWSIWTDQQDSLSQRDTGWAQFYCSSVQDVLDHVILAYRMAEEISVPVMIVEDAFVLSHTAEAVEMPSREAVDAFLPPRRPRFRLDVKEPRAFGGLLGPDVYQEVREDLHRALLSLDGLAPEIYGEWERLTGRSYSPVETYRTDDAEVVLLVSGAVASTAREFVDAERARRRRVGLVQVRMFRPFPAGALRDALRGVPKVAVIDRNCSFGHHGIFFQELKSALYGMDAAERPRAYGYVMGLGGRDIGPRSLAEVVRRTRERDLPEPETEWLGAVLPAAPEEILP
jgi:pyruvate/2-oxoacid:ferredoxin oxidoreductase alpha subunit